MKARDGREEVPDYRNLARSRLGPLSSKTKGNNCRACLLPNAWSCGMRVLFAAGIVNFQTPGGAEIAILKKMEHLARIGVEVNLFNPYKDKIENYDLVHLYQLSLSNYEIARFARNQRVPTVLQPVYWPIREYSRELAFGTIQQLTQTMLKLGRRSRYYTRFQAILPLDPDSLLMQHAQMITVNSRTEENVLRSHFPLTKRFAVVPAGVDARFANADPGPFLEKYNVHEFILTVGNIAPRKNTLRLIEAAKTLGVPLVVVGRPYDRFYFDRCLAAAKGAKVLFVPELGHESDLLSSCYAAATVFALPSWVETPGLSALEAAVAGCNLVITDRGGTTEYFSDQAIYVDPNSVASITAGLRKALDAPKNTRLKQKILAKCRWETVAGSLKDAYESVLR